MGSKFVEGSFNETVRKAAQKLGPCTVKQLIVEVSPFIPASRAARLGHQDIESNRKRMVSTKPLKEYSTEEIVALGKRRLVNNAVHALVQRNFLIRVNGLLCLSERNEASNLYDKVLECIERYDELPIGVVVRELSPFISSGEALKRYASYSKREWRRREVRNPKKTSLESKIAAGKRIILTDHLRSLFKKGKISKVRKGIYVKLNEESKC